MNCLVCGKQRIQWDGYPGGLDCPGVCGQCEADAKLGRLVRAMHATPNRDLVLKSRPKEDYLLQKPQPEFAVLELDDWRSETMGVGDTPEEALEKAGVKA